ncbi:hypothetical protein FVEG_15871 [Fusarium verticillioides 7600]|uniref:Major facilitator superfamily (MFS) profile domain-containing protein n=1 Tax=Gibberella moniliformis (strain M3125 / FGSC 7600) TaxID=334819 RepID=W7MMJ5_GIBM7|nr:hypothetical protein FVEG_15871 [Fusarium verticillioides 7600]EWG45862.1 hypothetical protein FVEG_15871 [Fusarium verticillioides 7600]
MFFGIGSGDIHLGRRIQLAFWLQVSMQYGTVIAAVVIYSRTIYHTAGFDNINSGWLSGLLILVGILGTAIAAFTIDRTFYVFGAAMFTYIPLVYCYLPETAGRTLEEVDYLFASKSPFTWDEEKELAKCTALLHESLNEGKNGSDSMTQDKLMESYIKVV